MCNKPYAIKYLVVINISNAIRYQSVQIPIYCDIVYGIYRNYRKINI